MKKLIVLISLIALIACGQISAETTQPLAADTSTQSRELNDSAEPETPTQSMSGSNSMAGNAMSGNSMGMSASNRTVNFDGIDKNEELSPEARTAIRAIAKHDEVAKVLSLLPEWDANAEQYDGDDTWYVDFSAEGEWAGWVAYDMANDELTEVEMVAYLEQDEIDAVTPQITRIALADPEIQALLDGSDISNWYTEAGYDRWEGSYYFYFERGLDTWIAWFWQEGDSFYLDRIVDPAALEAQEQQAWNREQAIEIAWEYPEVWERFDGVDDWTTYVTDQGNNRYAVSFATTDRELFYALIDIESREIIEAK